MTDSKRRRFALYNCIGATLVSLYALIHVLLEGGGPAHVAMAGAGFLAFLGLLVGVARAKTVHEQPPTI